MQNSIRILFHWFTRCKSSVQVCWSAGVEAPPVPLPVPVPVQRSSQKREHSIHLSIYLSMGPNWMGLSGIAAAVAIKSQMYELMFLSIIKCYGLFGSLSLLSICLSAVSAQYFIRLRRPVDCWPQTRQICVCVSFFSPRFEYLSKRLPRMAKSRTRTHTRTHSLIRRIVDSARTRRTAA